MLYFCTLFDSNYLSRGLALYESLTSNCSEFHLFVFAFDEICRTTLESLKISNITVIALSDFEDELLLRVKPGRTRAEYCWTCTPSTLKYVFDTFYVPSCTYIDADLYFFSSPELLINELNTGSVMITEHWFSPEYSWRLKYGRYCVQFMTFKNNSDGLNVLEWWRNACLEWCFDRLEEGRFGDQKYLDNWPELFPGIHVMKNRGGGIAPWNITRYEVMEQNGQLSIKDLKSGHQFPVVFFHAHYLKFYTNGKIDLGPYTLFNEVRRLIYEPYIVQLSKVAHRLHQIDPAHDYHGSQKLTPAKWGTFVRYLKHKLQGNVVSLSN